MKPSDIAKIAAQVTAGSISYEHAKTLLPSTNIPLLDSLITGAGGMVGGAIGGRVIGEVMDRTGITDVIDDVVGDLFDW